MALETLLVKVKTAIPPKLLKKKQSFKSKHQNVGVLAFEVAGTISKLLHLWHSLSDAAVLRLRNDTVAALDGVRKIVSDDESFLLGLACAEFAESLRIAAESVARLADRCCDPELREFRPAFREFADSGLDPNGWAQSGPKETEAKIKKLERYVAFTATLYREMEELLALENGLKKFLLNHSNNNNEGSFVLGLKDQQKVYDTQQKIFWHKQEVKDLKERSLWSRNFDSVVSLMVRFCFIVLARVKVVFGVGQTVPPLSRSLSGYATVHPSDHHHHHQNPSTPCDDSDSGSSESSKLEEKEESKMGSSNNSMCLFLVSYCKLLKPEPNTLGSQGLALHYANLIIVMEKMIKSPHLVGADARDDLYSMLPNSIRCALRARLKGSAGFCASDPALACEWRDALGRILGWLSPLAHNMIRWQSERSFEQHNLVPKTNVLLLQTLFFADKEKTEAAITELLVGLNYIWKFEREMTAKALFESASFNGGFLKLQKLSP
ncbi:hypothetical protein HN51_028508 [Arachis hypogaea]|uniref:DUF668 domain-containing protein n=2 Tax=Arachis TaxID=3817 RepID=A0A445BIP0_ARAHY|nr:uncharacterized protein LOC107466099 [Arachis duranensis]XP_025619507.1 uncharacterized protein LOC112711149 [Arachis hypogaea]QHO35013.1 uncharacterized protein DS421_9g271970 [Arachis hypogaea]RYR38524.1 hypothetical protein Ahy_A09g043566 isoform C [Arachis hypogaea]